MRRRAARRPGRRRPGPRSRRARPAAGRRAGPDAPPPLAAQVEALRAELRRRTSRAPARWNASPEEVQRSVARLVLTLVEFLRRLFERQALRRLEAGTLTARETEALGLALMRLEQTIRRLARHFGLRLGDLNLDLGPLGRLR